MKLTLKNNALQHYGRNYFNLRPHGSNPGDHPPLRNINPNRFAALVFKVSKTAFTNWLDEQASESKTSIEFNLRGRTLGLTAK
ncbi:hypothetical protein [Sunxiuqinia dokdonensis]|uniref:Uncharacterized protein n=1 Tax=Sunxiuqinia dokdonensis TaxID=1409788 RepID=A0A0L8VER9_9BACT|nr:hypothetical protein [Sunxiuqinia dokdonensis]KOH46858.1 hypothetical protein NC99_02580 [Sunxiuqinia dokdonensis]